VPATLPGSRSPKGERRREETLVPRIPRPANRPRRRSVQPYEGSQPDCPILDALSANARSDELMSAGKGEEGSVLQRIRTRPAPGELA
jgi:hypothetical protein